MKNKKLDALNLQKPRINAGMTQEEAGKAIGIDGNSIARYEQGKRTPTLARLVELAQLYEVSIAEFFGDDPVMSPAERRVLTLMRDNPRSATEMVHLLEKFVRPS